ncbi:hypothetical protein HPB52_025708 [Rhipicephalus sanguineus]|uniref:Endonuclease/exonuclease/phosphatase domain-containing protein n=1 Tax=Rhipicephalus sanguineus TaxID=34632 RepID=A0A9D4SN76_RHISA|nr:hypothetical protein HPB52_025708 [Rhipicephalus sanguineus]
MAKASHRDSLILLGDFNAAHTEWEKTAQQHNLTLMNLPNSPTRIGNSVERDTTPDLAFSNADRHTTWQRLEETLGSDHHIISISICTSKMRRPLGKARITDWNRFRERQQDWTLDNCAPTNATAWEEAIKQFKESALAFHPAPLPRPVATGMECVVEGHTISAEEWSDGSWQPSPGFRAQEKRRLELRQATPHQNAAQQATATRNDMKPRPPPQRKRGPLPRMPADTIHIVGRPKTPVDLTKLPPWQLYEALLKAASLPDQPPASRDKLRVHPTNNTFTISVPDSVRAQAYLRITSLQIGDRTIEFHVYAPPPDDAFRGIMFNAYDSFTDDEILKDLQESNSSMPVVSGRRMGEPTTYSSPCLETVCPDGYSITASTFASTLLPKSRSCFMSQVGHRTTFAPIQNATAAPVVARPPADPTGYSTDVPCPRTQPGAPQQHSSSILRTSRPPSQERRFNSSSSPLPCSPNSSQGSSPSSSTPVQEARLGPRTPESLKRADVVARCTETSTPSTLPGYATYHQLGSHAYLCTSTLVHNGLTAVQHEIEATGISTPHRSLFVLNVYSSPREKAADFSHLFSETIALVGDAQLLLLGDINARHPDWGYVHTDPKGRKLWSLVQDLRLNLLNDPQQPPTRIGNSVCRDTSLDLTLCKNTRLSKKPKATARITEWPKFRKLREERASDTITDINEWITSLQEHVQAKPARWRPPPTCTQPTHASSCGTHTLASCAGGDGSVKNKKLRRRLETSARNREPQSRPRATAMGPALQRLLHRYPGTDAELLDELALRYVSLASQTPAGELPPSRRPSNVRPTLSLATRRKRASRARRASRSSYCFARSRPP